MEVYRGAVIDVLYTIEVRTFIEAYECTLTSFFSCNCVRRACSCVRVCVCVCVCVCVRVCVCVCVRVRDEHIVVRYVARSRTVYVACTRCTQHVCCNRLHPPLPPPPPSFARSPGSPPLLVPRPHAGGLRLQQLLRMQKFPGQLHPERHHEHHPVLRRHLRMHRDPMCEWNPLRGLLLQGQCQPDSLPVHLRLHQHRNRLQL